MGRAFAESVPAARAVFDEADRIVGYDLTSLCFEGPLEQLSETSITQPALVSATLACLAAVHESGLRAGIGKAVRNFIETHNLSPKGVTLSAEDIREGMTGVLSVFIQEPQFQGQTKDRLNNPELVSAVDGVVRPALEHWLNHNASIANQIVARIILAARAREASRAARLPSYHRPVARRRRSHSRR